MYGVLLNNLSPFLLFPKLNWIWLRETFRLLFGLAFQCILDRVTELLIFWLQNA